VQPTRGRLKRALERIATGTVLVSAGGNAASAYRDCVKLARVSLGRCPYCNEPHDECAICGEKHPDSCCYCAVCECSCSNGNKP